MPEYVGDCKQCGKAIYCENGFLDGVVFSNDLVCFTCCDNDS